MKRFGFVIHPLNIEFIHNHPSFGWTKHFPDSLIEAIGAVFPPFYLGKIDGVVSVATGEEVEGLLYTLGATPKKLLQQPVWITNAQLAYISRMAKKRNAQIMGLGAFTSVVGDAGVLLSKKIDLPITTGNSLTAAVTVETSKDALRKVGKTDIQRVRVMIVGASGSIGSACARILAPQVDKIYLIGRHSAKLSALKKEIAKLANAAQIFIAEDAHKFISKSDLIITTTSAVKTDFIGIDYCKPRAVICDVAKPVNVSLEEASRRKDVLVIESGNVIPPGTFNVTTSAVEGSVIGAVL